MKSSLRRRTVLQRMATALAAVVVFPLAKSVRGAVKKVLVSEAAPRGYDPDQHKWTMAIDVNRCIGCGLCAKACKQENHVPEGPSSFRTWIERYIIKRAEPGSEKIRGEVIVDSPNGGMDGFAAPLVPPDQILQSFFVPKLCNLCGHSPCAQVCPVGATFDTPDGVVLVDPKYCIGCGFCIQACPYGCRFLNHETGTAEKCSLCYHRITRGLRPACVEVCPTQSRLFGDLKNLATDDPLVKFFEQNRVRGLKGHMGTDPRVQYAGLDKEVR